MRGRKQNPAGKPLRSTDLAMLPRTSNAPSYFVDIVDTRYSPPRVLEARVRRTDASATIALARSEKMRFIKLRPHRVNPSPGTVAGNLEPYLRGVTIPAGFVADFNNNDNTPRYWNKQLRLALFVGHHDKNYRDSHDEGSHRFQVVRTDDDGDLGEYEIALETSNPRVLLAWLRKQSANRSNPERGVVRTLQWPSNGVSRVASAAEFVRLFQKSGDRLKVGEIVDDRIPPKRVTEIRDLEPGRYELFGFVNGRTRASWAVWVVRGAGRTRVVPGRV